MNVLSLLKNVRTSAQFEETIPKIEDDLRQAHVGIAALKAQREAAIFDGSEATLTKLLGDIREAELRAETLQIALEGARRRQAEAEAAEHKAKLEARHREALKLSTEERRLLKAWHLAAKKLADITAEVDAVQRAIDVENVAMRGASRPDLVLPNLAREVNATRRDIWDRHFAGVEHPPSNPPVSVSLNVGSQFQIPNYWPVPAEGRVVPVQPLALLE